MIKLDFSIGSIKYSLDRDDDEAETFREIIKVLNTKTNEIMMNTGKIDDKLILFMYNICRKPLLLWLKSMYNN